MGNSGETGFLHVLERLVSDKDEVVREGAEWAVRKLENGDQGLKPGWKI